MPACDLAHHAAHLRAVERRERNDAVVRAHGPGRSEFRPRGGDDQQGDCAPRSASARRRSSEVGSAQCKSSKAMTAGCERAPARTQPVIAASCRRRNSSGEIFARRSSGSGTSTSGASRGAYSAASRPISLKVFSRSARRPSSTRVGDAKAQSAPFGERVQGRVLQELRGGPFDPSVRRLGEFRAKLLDQTRLADAWLADDLDELTLAFERARPAAHEKAELVLAPDERRQGARPAAPAAAARAHDAIEHDRGRHALEVMRALVLGDEQPGRLALHARRDEHRSRLGRGLHPRGDVGRLAEHFPGRVHHHLARIRCRRGRPSSRRVSAGRSWR